MNTVKYWGQVSGYHGEKGMENTRINLGVIGEVILAVHTRLFSPQFLFSSVPAFSTSFSNGRFETSLKVGRGNGLSTYQQG
jgi:hypothetical protein